MPQDRPTLRESEMRALIRKRYQNKQGVEWVILDEVSDAVGGMSRRVDMMAVSCWSSSNHAVHAIEIKVSRSDWLKELDHPEKRAPFEDHVNEFWFACAPGIAKVDEVPDGCGLLLATNKGDKLIRKKRARYMKSNEPDGVMWRSMLRNGTDQLRLYQRKFDNFAELHGEPVSLKKLESLVSKLYRIRDRPGDHREPPYPLWLDRWIQNREIERRKERKRHHAEWRDKLKDLMERLSIHSYGFRSVDVHSLVTQVNQYLNNTLKGSERLARELDEVSERSAKMAAELRGALDEKGKSDEKANPGTHGDPDISSDGES